MDTDSKRGSSRRKGDEYQDLTALRFALEYYISRKPFELFIEYEKSGNLDDIVVIEDGRITAYQVKYAVNRLDVYQANDLTDPDSPVYFRKFADSWKSMCQRFPKHEVAATLCSNRALAPELVDLVTPDGMFTPEVIADRRRGEAKTLRSKLVAASGLDETAFQEFLKRFQFFVRQPTLAELEVHIRAVLLDQELGLSDHTVFLHLKDVITHNAIYLWDPITAQTINRLVEQMLSSLLMPQVFPVEHNQFVLQEALSRELDRKLMALDGSYLIVTGLPGSGKSTSLTMYFDALPDAECEVFRYYCFVGINDNAQRMRVQAESLRANLLEAFHRKYPDVLTRRFDHSTGNFLKCLEALAKHFAGEGRRFVIFLDGLDHAERLEADVRDTVISALPAAVPKGAVIVVGTQELHKWPHFLQRARECPESHIAMPLFSEAETRDYLVVKRAVTWLSRPDVIEVHRKSEGLPLYLRYAAELLLSAGAGTDIIASLTPATGGDIRNYYAVLWEELERSGMGDARHLCAVFACLRFCVHRTELYEIQHTLSRPAFEDAFKRIGHLLRGMNGLLTVFHDSFREFVISRISEDWVHEVRGHIAVFLKGYRQSPRWFQHVFQYCYDVGDYEYPLREIDAAFVDDALLKCRPSEEILSALSCAIECAFKAGDIVELSRLASLQSRTHERLDHTLDRSLLARALLAMGREQDVMTFAYSADADHWLVAPQVSLAVLARLAEEGRIDLGQRLFDVFTDEFRGVVSDSSDEVRAQVTSIATCLGIYAQGQARPLRWLSRFKLAPGILETKDAYAPGYAPQLGAYIDALVRFGRRAEWTRIIRVKRLFPNRLVRYLLIRALARHGSRDDLRAAITEYLAVQPESGNVELAFYAAKAGMLPSLVARIAGTITAPKVVCPEYVSRSDPMLRCCVYSFTVLAYEDNEESYAHLSETIGSARTLWNSALRHLLKACSCIGREFRHQRPDWFNDAQESIQMLVSADQGEGERICESIEIIRGIVTLTVGSLTDCVQARFPDQMTAWIETVGKLRDSFLWNTHFGISESRVDYDFELSLWDTLVKMPAVRPPLIPILRECARTFEAATMLKGQCRSDHFLLLAAIMATCGARDDAGKWLQYGIRASLIYGYHKDVTLLYLIQVLTLVNRHRPALALERCARVLSMVDWMPHLTDGRETTWFTEKAFTAVLSANRQAAFDLLRHFAVTTSRWKMQDCLEQYVLATDDCDPEYLWCLTELFANHYSEDGKHCNQVMRARQHIVDLAARQGSRQTAQDLAQRYRLFILTEVPPRHWPKQLREDLAMPAPVANETSGENPSKMAFTSEYILDGVTVSKATIEKRCQASFGEYLCTFEKLKAQNERFYERELAEALVHYHIEKAKSNDDLLSIKEYVHIQGRYQNSRVIESLAERFEKMGDQGSAIACLRLAYKCYGDWFRWQGSRKYLAAVAGKDHTAAKQLILDECYDSACGSGGGYDTAPIAATGLDVLNEPEKVDRVFNDFLTHCEGMFAQLPQKGSYVWLKDFRAPANSIEQRILEFVLDELATTEVDHGERLVCALTRLSVAHPAGTIPLLVDRAGSATRRSLRRLLAVLDGLSHRIPGELASFQVGVAKLLTREDFFCRQTVLAILGRIEVCTELHVEVKSLRDHVRRQYSDSMGHSSYRLPTSSTPEFADFLKRKVLFDFSNQLTLAGEILRVRPGSIIAAIEERLRRQKWTMDAERERLKDDWHGNVHPQGWPVVWITTDFQETAMEALWSILDEAAGKMTLSEKQMALLWNTFQVVDPEYMLHGVMPRPLDIRPLCVCDKDAWFGELNSMDSMAIDHRTLRESDDDWLTVFEKRRMAQEEKFNVPYRQDIALFAYLIPQRVYSGAHDLDELDVLGERISPRHGMAVTLQQARDSLADRGNDAFDASADCMPLVATHQNPVTFQGYMSVCFLASHIIDRFALGFDGMRLCRDGKTVASFEAWQEGYQDECYTREKLSFGVRFRVSRSFLRTICSEYQKMLCIRIDEKREAFKSIYRPEADEKRDGRRYILVHPS